jgi:hypothetical protein
VRRLFFLVTAVALIVGAAMPALGGPGVPTADGDDDKVTGLNYVRHDGGTDIGIEHCEDPATNPAADDDLEDTDIDSNDGGSRRQGNEPYSVVDPTNPDHVFAGWNDYCLTDLGAGWQGFAFSTDGGESWTDSIVPGYPQDTSAEGQKSPLFGNHTDAGDPIAAFDNDGNLFVGGISFNRVGKQLGHVYVSTWLTDPPAWTGGNESLYPVDYERTVIVGEGTPAPLTGIFMDKPMLEVDRTGGTNDGNVYVCWSKFPGNAGQNLILFSRSTDTGETFSKPIGISKGKGLHSGQGCDIAVEEDGTIHVIWRVIDDSGSKTRFGIGYTRSTDGGLRFSPPRLIHPITIYFPSDGTRDCGDGPTLCPSEFVFFRVPLEPRVTSDQTGQLPGVYVTYNAVDESTIEESDTTYSSAGPNSGLVGQSLVYVIGSTNGGDDWGDPVTVDPTPEGHQFFPDIDAHAGRMGVVWQDNREEQPCYSVQLPIGNTSDATACGYEGTNAYFSYSFDGETFGASTKVSDVGHQASHEMFANRDVPFQGDYNWISLALRQDGSVFAYFSWTDNRDVQVGTDPREEEQDGFDVLQCRTETEPDVWSADTCANAGGLDQNIYGNSAEFPA